jgi:two-component sensor histidine kinase
LKTLTLILTCFIIPLLGSAQHYYTRTFTIDDGLPSNQINCLYQDSTGFLWIGTNAGIAVFDGSDFRIINKNDGLASNDIRAITQDAAGNFWFACYDGGLTKYDGKDFTSFTKKEGLYSNFIRRVYYSRSYKTLFIGADEGFYTLKDGKFTLYGKVNGKLAEQHEVLWFLEGKGFIYVFPFSDNLIKFYPSTGQINQMKADKSERNRWWSMTSALVLSNKDTVWGNQFAISDNNGLRYAPTPITGMVFSIAEGEKGMAWLPIWSSQTWGILRYNGLYFEDFTSKLGLDNIKCTTVHYDKQSGTLWVGTEGNGLRAVPQNRFSYYPLSLDHKGNQEFRKLFYCNGVPCLLFQKQIVKFNPTDKFEIIPISILEQSESGELISNILKKGQDKIQILNTEFWRIPEFFDITRDSQRNVWVSSTVGFYRLSSTLKTVTKALPIDTRYGHIMFDTKDNLFNWGFWQDKLDLIPDPNKQVSPYQYHKYSKVNAELPKDISKMIQLGNRMMLSSLYGGLYLYNGSSFIHLNKTNPELPFNISDLCLDVDNNVVYSTSTGEVGIGSIVNGKFKHKRIFESLDKAYGRNFIWAICDKRHNIYVGTNKGMLIIHYPPVHSSRAEEIRFYSRSEGYMDFSVSSPILDDSGNVWLASQNNLLRIDAEAISDTPQSPTRIVLTKLETTDSAYTFTGASGISNTTDWKFSYNSNNITFHFNSINLLNPEKDRFSVQLEGFDGSFRDIGADRKAIYTNLPAGKYKFVVRVVNSNTLQKQSQVLLEFTIRSPYWQTWWFYAIISLVLIAILWIVNATRVRRIKKETKAQLEIAELEMQALQAQMNPHFVFNVMNSLQRYILERNAEKGIQVLSDFSSMIRQTFSLSTKKYISLQEEITYLESYLKLEQERFAYKFRYKVSADIALNPNDVMIPSMLIQPLVENAVKHGLSPLEGTDGELIVLFTGKDKQSLKCTIEDNGIGVKKSLAAKQDNKTNLSKALTITQRRIELLGRSNKDGRYSVTITDRSQQQSNIKGTCVEIIIPIQVD